MLRAGLDLDGKLLALAAASHSGEAFHVAGVREILAGAGLNEGALRCPPALPLDERALRRVLREGGDADRVHMNCSGKHAAMLATCAAAGWPTGGYLDPDHPLQRAIRRTVEHLLGEPAAGLHHMAPPGLSRLPVNALTTSISQLASVPNSCVHVPMRP